MLISSTKIRGNKSHYHLINIDSSVDGCIKMGWEKKAPISPIKIAQGCNKVWFVGVILWNVLQWVSKWKQYSITKTNEIDRKHILFYKISTLVGRGNVVIYHYLLHPEWYSYVGGAPAPQSSSTISLTAAPRERLLRYTSEPASRHVQPYETLAWPPC